MNLNLSQCIVPIFNKRRMEEPKVKRSKKSDKAKKTHDKNGSFSQKHVRYMEALAEKRK